MKNLKLTLLVLFFSIISILNSKSQNNKFEISWGNDQKPFNEGFIKDMKILKTDDNYICYFLNTCKLATVGGFQRSHYFLAKYDRKTTDYKWIEINPDEQKKKMTFLSYDTINNVLHSFTYFHNKEQKKLYVFDETFNYENLTSNNDIKKISEIDLSDKGSLLDNMFIVSDNGRFLFRYSCKSRNGDFYGLEVFNNKLEREWGTFTMARTEAGYNIESDYKIDKDGNVFAIQRNFEKESDVGRHYDRSRIWAVCYPSDGQEPTSLPLVLKNDYFVTGERLSINKQNQIICAGLYAMPGTVSAVGGFSFVIEPKLKKIISINTNEFSKESLLKGVDLKKKDSDIKKINEKKDFEKNFGYNFKDIHYRKDGGFDLIAEKFYQLYVIKNNIQTIYNYYDDLWVLSFYADGKFKWVQKIPKYEYLIDFHDSLGGYFSFYDNNDNLNLIFNIAKSKLSLFSNKCSGTTVKISLDIDGNESFVELINDNTISTSFIPKYSFKEDNGGIILTRCDNVNSIFPTPGKHNFLCFGELKFKF